MSDELIEALFRRTGKKSEDLEKIADEILALPDQPQPSPKCQRLVDMMNDLDGRVFGPQEADKSKQSGTRQLIETEREEVAKKAIVWSATGKFTREELIPWLKKYFAVRQYGKDAGLATEFIDRLGTKRGNDQNVN